MMRTTTIALMTLATLPAASCGNAATDDPPRAAPKTRIELMVYAAASTQDALRALEHAYEADHAVDLVFNFASSGELARQILAASHADVFLSADEREMDRVDGAGLLAAGSRIDLLANQLVVVVTHDEPFAHFTLEDLAGPRVERLSLADAATVPAGRYARAWLEQNGWWSRVESRVLPAIDARAALGAVESGAAQAGIVYRTDAARSKHARIVHVVPVDAGPCIVYPLAVLAGRPQERAARAFAEFLRGDSARATFDASGFMPAPHAAPAIGSPR